jgi:DnaJ-domain-containing protein 1
VSIGKRIWDVTRANLTDFGRTFRSDGLREQLTDAEREAIDAELRESIGARAGRRAREIKDTAEDAWERAFEQARARAGVPQPRVDPNEQRRRWAKTLEIELDATPDEIRRAYRRLLVRFHPDKFATDPEKYKVATEVTRKLTEAYNGLLGG